MNVVTFAVQGNFAYSFILGVLAAVNPCGFVLLPAYLLYFLGLDNSGKATTRHASLARALGVSGAVSAGFIVVFLVVGTISRLFTQWLELHAKYAGFAIGIAMLLLGIAMLVGWKPPLTTPHLRGGNDRTFISMLMFGIAYAVASIGCTIGFLTTAIFGSIATHGFISGVISIVLYGAGMALLVSTLTVTLAFAQRGLLSVLRNGLKYIDRLAAGFILLTGAYLILYWNLAITGSRSSPSILQHVEHWQSQVAMFLQRQGAHKLAAVFVLVVGAALMVIVRSLANSHQDAAS